MPLLWSVLATRGEAGFNDRGAHTHEGPQLMKSEPHVYSYDDLVADGQTHWDGVRNYQARNMMRDQMKVGDLVLYYLSHQTPACCGSGSRRARGLP